LVRRRQGEESSFMLPVPPKEEGNGPQSRSLPIIKYRLAILIGEVRKGLSLIVGEEEAGRGEQLHVT
jgi:hypothetical protein